MSLEPLIKNHRAAEEEVPDMGRLKNVISLVFQPFDLTKCHKFARSLERIRVFFV